MKRGDPNKPKSPNENTYGLTVKNFYLNLEWERYTLDNKKRIVFSLDGKQGPNYKSRQNQKPLHCPTRGLQENDV